MSTKDLGQRGEQMVETYLTEKGYQILERNYRQKTGEIDLIVKNPEGDEIIFIEVKTRQSEKFGHPEEAVDRRKLKKIEKTALFWLNEYRKTNTLWRIDILALELKDNITITHFQNVSL